MDTIRCAMRRTVLIAAVPLALLPAAAIGQDKAGSTSSPSSAGTTQAQGGTAGASGQSGTGGTSAASPGATGTQQGDKTKLPAGHPPVTYLLVPLAAPEQNQWMKKGCWVRLHDNQNFGGDSITLMGPVDMPDMVGPFGIDWKGKISSVETGPKATLTVYDNENYRDLVSTFEPGKKNADVSKKMGFFDEFSSLKIACGGGKAASSTKK